jgi:hypothetical protein
MPSSNVLWVPPLTRLTPWYPGQFGVPGSDVARGLRMDVNGAVYYVDPNHADANTSADGTNPDQPLSTVAAALAKCRAYCNDTIVVMANSDQTQGDTSVGRATPIAESVTVTVPGVRIVGVFPSGTLGVPWVPTANNATAIRVYAMDVLIEGFCFWEQTYTNFTGVYAQYGGGYYGDNLTVRNCSFMDADYGIALDFSWNSYIENCLFDGIDVAAIYNVDTHGSPDWLHVSGCFFESNAIAITLPNTCYNYITGNYFMENTSTILMNDVSTNNIIHGNVIYATPGGTNNMIDLSGSASGLANMVSDNWLSCTVAQYDTTCSPGGGGTDIWCRNHCGNGETAANPT